VSDSVSSASNLDGLIARAAELLCGAECAVALTGAGISTPSGIPDFRGPDSGLWDQADPFAVASISAFQRSPQDFYDWIRPLARVIEQAQPNPAHHALARLESAGLLKSIVTQNIDGLHQRAGSGRVHEVHGHIREATCIRCHHVVPTDGLIGPFLDGGEMPHCSCGGVLKPNVILVGEQLPVKAVTVARQDAAACDLMLVAGSSLEVVPAADLPSVAVDRGSRLIIVNYEPTYLDETADVIIHHDVAAVLPRIADMAINPWR
jgi:NAD-dependent deacetylase